MGKRHTTFDELHSVLLQMSELRTLSRSAELGKNCTMELRGAGTSRERIEVRYKATTILIAYPDGTIILRFGGIRSLPIVRHMNAWQSIARVFRANNVIFIQTKTDRHPLGDDTIVTPDGRISSRLNGIDALRR